MNYNILLEAGRNVETYAVLGIVGFFSVFGFLNIYFYKKNPKDLDINQQRLERELNDIRFDG